jgi:hypothetical protein
MCVLSPFVIAGLDPAIQLLAKRMNARVKPGHDPEALSFYLSLKGTFTADLYQSRICAPFQCSTPSKRRTWS